MAALAHRMLVAAVTVPPWNRRRSRSTLAFSKSNPLSADRSGSAGATLLDEPTEGSTTALVRRIFIEELALLIGKSVTTIRTCSSNPKYHHLIPRPHKLPNSRRLSWTVEEVQKWMNSSRPAEPPPARRPRGRPTKAEQLSRSRWANSSTKNAAEGG